MYVWVAHPDAKSLASRRPDCGVPRAKGARPNADKMHPDSHSYEWMSINGRVSGQDLMPVRTGPKLKWADRPFFFSLAWFFPPLSNFSWVFDTKPVSLWLGAFYWTKSLLCNDAFYQGFSYFQSLHFRAMFLEDSAQIQSKSNRIPCIRMDNVIFCPDAQLSEHHPSEQRELSV
jgi:hypothetical protein